MMYLVCGGNTTEIKFAHFTNVTPINGYLEIQDPGMIIIIHRRTLVGGFVYYTLLILFCSKRKIWENL